MVALKGECRAEMERQNLYKLANNMAIINIASIFILIVCCACDNGTFSVNQCLSQVTCSDSYVCTCPNPPINANASYTQLVVGEKQTVELSSQSTYMMIDYAEVEAEKYYWLQFKIAAVGLSKGVNLRLLLQLFAESQANQIYANDTNPIGYQQDFSYDENTSYFGFGAILKTGSFVLDLSITKMGQAEVTVLFQIQKMMNPSMVLIIAASVASIIGVAAVAFVIYCLYKRHKTRMEIVQKMNYKEQLVDKFKNETPQVLAKSIHIPKMSTCSICLGDFDPEDKIRKIVCSHIFHSECIDSWCKKNLNCPVCRLELDEQSLKKKKKEIELMDYNWQENPLGLRQELLIEEKSKRGGETNKF